MRRLMAFLGILNLGLGFAQPTLVYEPPKVAKFEVFLHAGPDYYVDAGLDWRIGYPFLAGIFYEKERGMDGVGVRVKVRTSLFWKVKNDLGLGVVLEKRTDKRAGLRVEAEQVVFLRRSFSLRLLEAYVFGSREVERWTVAVGFGF